MSRRRIHILHLMNVSDIGGAERMMLTLAQALDPKQFKICVVCLHGGRLAEEVRRLGFPFYALPAKNPAAFALNFFRIIKLEKIDLVQTYGARAEVIGAIMASLCGVHCVVSSLHDLYSFDNYFKRLVNRIADPFIDHYVAVSRIVGNLAATLFHIPRRRIRVIENGITAGQPQQKEAALALRRQLGVSPQQRMIITVANLRPVKGHIHILQAVSLMSREEREGLKFCFVGADFCGGEVQRNAKLLGVDDSIIFAGFQAEIFLYLQAADAFLLASESEGSSLSLLEALAVGCPVIAANVGGPHEIIADHETGILIPPKSPAAIKEQVLGLLSNRALREKLIANGLEATARRFSAARMAEEYKNFYRQVLKKAESAHELA